MQKRTYLTITPDVNKDALRAAGRLADGNYALEYDPSEKLWFAKPGADLERVKPWLPENTVSPRDLTTTGNLTPAEEFAKVLQDAGFIFPSGDLPEMDGKRHRAYVEGQKNTPPRKNEKGDYPGGSGVYQGFLDGRPAGWYENHRASEGKVNWTSTGSHTHDPAETMKQRAQAAQKRWDRQIQSQQAFAQMGKTLSRQWQKMPPPPETHAYLLRKGVPATDGVRLDKYDNLVIPLRNIDGELRSLQYIKPDGTKNLKKDAEKTGNFFVVGGELSPQRPVLYAEGYATAASLHLATGMPVVMTVDAGNLVTVSRNLKARYPDSHHIILGEDDFTRINTRGEQDNKGTKKAQEAAAAINGIYLIPSFTDSERAQAFAGTASFSDFNDIHVARGLDAVREQLAPVLDPLLPHWRQTFSEENTMPAKPTTATAPDKAVRPETERETITLYHGSPATFSAIDTEKTGAGQNLVGRGFYTDTSVTGVHYVMEEINHKDYHIYECEIPSDAIILDRLDSSSLTDELRERIREAGKTVHQQLTESGENSQPDLGDRLADCEKIDNTFLMFAGSLQGMRILQAAGIDALKDNSYVAIVNTDLIDNIRLHSAGGKTRAEMAQYIDNASGNVAQDTARLSAILQEKPAFSVHYDAIRSELVTLAKMQNRPEEAERLTALLTHTLVETIDSSPDRKTSITPLNRLYAEATRSLDLSHSNSAAALGRLIDSAVVNMNPVRKPAAGPDRPEARPDEPRTSASVTLQENGPVSATDAPLPGPDTGVTSGNSAQAESTASPVSSPASGPMDIPGPDVAPPATDDELLQMYLAGQDTAPPSALPPDAPASAIPVPEAPSQPLRPVSPQTATVAAPVPETDGILLAPDRQPGQQAPSPDDATASPAPPVSHDRPAAERIDLDALLQRISHDQQKDGTVLYSVDERPAFYDHGSHLTMAPDASTQNDAVLAALMTAAAHYQGRITLTGSDAFKERAVALIARYDLKVSMKTAAQQAMLDDARRALQLRSDRIDVAPPGPQAAPPEMTASPEPVAPVPAEDNPSAPAPKKGQYTGVLLAHGPAPYQHREKASASYYVTLETRRGQETIWGVELAKAVSEYNCRPGQVVNLNYRGKEQVLIRVPEKDENGRDVFREKQVHRNSWEMKPARERNVKSSAAPEAGEKLSAFSAETFSDIQRTLPLPPDMPALPDGGSYLWHRPDGRASTIPGDKENAAPPVPQGSTGKPVMTVTDETGAKVLQLFTSAGPYLQGVAHYKGRWQHVLATLNGPEGTHAITINAVTQQGLRHIGSADPVNKVEGKPVENPALLAVSLGKNNVVPARLEQPENLPAGLFRQMGFDGEWTPPRDESPKQEARARATPAQHLRPQ